MRIRDIIKRLLTRSTDVNAKTAKDKNGATPMDLRKAECPYCRKVLDKIPNKKIKCPYCGEFMYVRTRPKNNARVVVTKAEADKIEEEWARIHGHDRFIARDPSRKEKFEKERKRLRKEFGKEPSERDVIWGILNKEIGEHAQPGNWGLYRNTRLDMADILRKEMKLKHALEIYLEVCYIDLNGPSNLGGISDPELLKKFPPFDPKEGFLAPGVVFEVKEIMKKLEFDKNKVKLIFIEHNSNVFKSLQLPLTPENCWLSLEREI